MYKLSALYDCKMSKIYEIVENPVYSKRLCQHYHTVHIRTVLEFLLSTAIEVFSRSFQNVTTTDAKVRFMPVAAHLRSGVITTTVTLKFFFVRYIDDPLAVLSMRNLQVIACRNPGLGSLMCLSFSGYVCI